MTVPAQPVPAQPVPAQPQLKYGRRPPTGAPALRFAQFHNGAVPDHPATEDYLAALHGGWQMLGNDVEGDCNAVTWANERRLLTATLGTEHYPGIDQVLEFYKTQNPRFDPDSATDGPGSDADQGMVIQDGLNFLHKQGGPDGVKPVAFAKVNVADRDEVQAALAVFGALWLGILVVQGNQEEFSRGEAWTYRPGAAVEGGHAVLAGGYDPQVKFITWGAETELADSFWNASVHGTRLVEEAWVVVWPEQLGSRQFQQGVDLTALADAYHQLTGRTLPLPTPPPDPAPTPSPNPSPSPPPGGGASFQLSAAVAARLGKAAARAGLSGDAWLEHHLRSYFHLS